MPVCKTGMSVSAETVMAYMELMQMPNVTPHAKGTEAKAVEDITKTKFIMLVLVSYPNRLCNYNYV